MRAQRSLSGKKLSVSWPEIATRGEHDRILHTLPQGSMAIDTFSFSLSNEKTGKQLLYLAVNHSVDPGDPQFEVIEQQFITYKADCVLYEGPHNRLLEPNKRDAIERFGGETGFLRWLVKEHNKQRTLDEKEVAIASGDMSREEEVNGMQKAGFANETIAAWLTAGEMYFRAQVNPNMQEAEEQFREYFEHETYPGSLSYLLTLLPREDGQQWTIPLLSEEYRRATGKPLTLDNQHPNDLPEMFDADSKIRDTYQVHKICQAIRRFNRVMVVMGSGHPIRQRKALEEFFS